MCNNLLTKIFFILALVTPVSYPAYAYATNNTQVITNVEREMSEEEKVQAFFTAVENEDVDKVKSLIEGGLSINVKNSSGDNALGAILKVNTIKERPERLIIIDYLLDKGISIDHIDGLGWTYLHHAVGYNYLSTVKRLLDRGIDYKVSSPIGGTAIFFAKTADMAKLLLTRKSGNIDEVNEDGDSLLHNVCGANPLFELVKFYSKKIDVNIKNKKGETPLTKLLSDSYFPNEMMKIINYLLDHGADINVVDNDGQSPLMAALRNRELQMNIIELLIDRGADVDIQDKRGIQPIHFAAMKNLDILKLLESNGVNLNARSGNSETPLIGATRYNKKETVYFLLSKKVDPNVADRNGKTALNYARERQHSDIVKMLEDVNAVASSQYVIEKAKAREEKKEAEEKQAQQQKIENIKDAARLDNLQAFTGYYKEMMQDNKLNSEKWHELAELSIKNGAFNIFIHITQHVSDINALDNDGYSLLHNAVFYNQLEIAKHLVQNGLDINHKSNEGRTVFILAANSSIDMVEYLLGLGVNTDDEKDFVNEAVRYGKPDIARFMMKSGYEVDKGILNNDSQLIRYIQRSDTETLNFLFEQGLDIEKKIKYRRETATLLHMAIMFDKPEVAIFLLNKGAKPHVQTDGGQALFEAAINHENMEVLNLMYDKGADLDATTGLNKETPLMLAFDLNRIDVIMMLIKRGADLKKTIDFRGNTPLHYAASFGYLEAAKLMIEKGADSEAKNKDNKTALDFAIEGKNKAVEEYLKNLKK